MIVCLISRTEVYAESGQEAGEVGTARGSKYRQILRLKTVHALAFFLLVYVGTEVSGLVWFPGVSIVYALAQVTIGGV
jgi:fucose permease